MTADEVPRLREQLDESRQVEERLNKSENVIEKYKKKLEDSAGLRRQLRQLEDENIVVTAKNSELEVELRKLTASKAVGDNYRSQVEAFEKKADQHAREFAQLAVTLEETQAKLVQTQTERDRLRGEVNVTEERIKELEGPAVAQPNPDESLNIELEDDDADGTSKIE